MPKKDHIPHGFKSKRQFELLVCYVTAVLSGFRDGYLVDCCSSEPAALSALFHDAKYFPADNQLLVVPMGDDNIVIRRDVLFNKLKMMEQNNWSNHPAVIDIDGAISRICSSSELEAISHILLQSISLPQEGSTLVVLRPDLMLEKVGFPFVAGWLLGYPCIYFTHIPSTLSGNTCLSMTLLLKIKISLRNGLTESQIDLQEYTIPKCILGADREISAAIETALDWRMADLNAKLENCPITTHLVSPHGPPYHIDITREECIFPSLVL